MPGKPITSPRTGPGGELHQQPSAAGAILTTTQGLPVSDNQNSLRASLRGPLLLEDFILRGKITHFDHERIPDRIVHARGTGARGYFELTKSLSEYTRAGILTKTGVPTPVFARFSTVARGAGSADTPRDVRGFAVKFYTDEGNRDLVGNNIPVFFFELSKVETASVRERMTGHLRVIDEPLAQRVAGGLGMAKLPLKAVPAQPVRDLALSPSALLLTNEAAAALSTEAAAIDFVRDAFGHLKAIALNAGGRAVFDAAGLPSDSGVIEAGQPAAFIRAAGTRQWDREPSLRAIP